MHDNIYGITETHATPFYTEDKGLQKSTSVVL